MKFKTLIYVFVIAALVFNCSSSSNDDLDPDPTPTTVTYNNTVKSIINNNCGSCHGDPTANGAPISYNTFTSVKNDVNDILTRINSNSNPMPPTGLMSSSLRAQIQKWKDDGLLEN